MKIRNTNEAQQISLKLLSPIHSLLEESDRFTKDKKEILSRYFYKIENLAADFDNMLNGLEAYYKLILVRNLTSKGELIDTIICGSISKTLRSITKILDMIGILAL
ncbi:uncharacterized protein RSE6_14802 [Rhynchosporium secalis]|uniref:Uncharacterized protein n=1 Tax=Rhynchosporium secalis TaxID=38038 RepID=A0A1E1MW64_RHYSE|nr:uncharacterized protein RSE6_14802 [Rhynchosporium secalis]